MTGRLAPCDVATMLSGDDVADLGMATYLLGGKRRGGNMVLTMVSIKESIASYHTRL